MGHRLDATEVNLFSLKWESSVKENAQLLQHIWLLNGTLVTYVLQQNLLPKALKKPAKLLWEENGSREQLIKGKEGGGKRNK